MAKKPRRQERTSNSFSLRGGLCEGKYPAFLRSDDLVSSVQKLSVEVLKEAVVTWQQSNSHIFDLLRRNGTKEALIRQFEELYGQ